MTFCDLLCWLLVRILELLLCSVEFCTWADVKFEVLCNGADGAEVRGVVEMFVHGFRSDLPELVFHGLPHAYSVHGDPCRHRSVQWMNPAGLMVPVLR